MKFRVLILFAKFSWLHLQRLTRYLGLYYRSLAPHYSLMLCVCWTSWGCQPAFWFARTLSYNGAPCPAARTCVPQALAYGGCPSSWCWKGGTGQGSERWRWGISCDQQSSETPRWPGPWNTPCHVSSAQFKLGLELSNENSLVVRSFIILNFM